MSEHDAGSMTGPADRLALADWRRRVAELYAEVRHLATADPVLAWDRWRVERAALFRLHPQSPVPAAERASFRARHWPYDPALRFSAVLEPAAVEPATVGAVIEPAAVEPATVESVAGGGPLALPSSGAEAPAFRRLGRVMLPLPSGTEPLAVFWVNDYAGGVFLPFRDATNGGETYGAGRYLLDSAKGADLGAGVEPGTLVVDLNFAFHPSCAFDARWSCPLAPPENRLGLRIEAGERLR